MTSAAANMVLNSGEQSMNNQNSKEVQVNNNLENFKGSFIGEVALSAIFGKVGGKLVDKLSKKKVNSDDIAKRSVIGTIVYKSISLV